MHELIATRASTSCEILVKIGAVIQTFREQKLKICRDNGCNLMIILYLALWRSETDWNIKILISAG